MNNERVLQVSPSAALIHEGERSCEELAPLRRQPQGGALPRGRVFRELSSGELLEEGAASLGAAVALALSLPVWAILILVLSLII